MKPFRLQEETRDNTRVSEPKGQNPNPAQPLTRSHGQPAADGNPQFQALVGYLGGRLSLGRIWQKGQHLHLPCSHGLSQSCLVYVEREVISGERERERERQTDRQTDIDTLPALHIKKLLPRNELFLGKCVVLRG